MPVETGKNIEVIEFFSYGCPHCGELEPILQTWLKNKPADVTFRRVPGHVPAALGERWRKIYYALEAMGDEASFRPRSSPPSTARRRLWTRRMFLDWAASKGLDRKKVEDLFNSFAIVGKVNRAKQLAQAYSIQSVPTIIVDGKYTTGPERQADGHAALPRGHRRAGAEGARRAPEVLARAATAPHARLPHRRLVGPR